MECAGRAKRRRRFQLGQCLAAAKAPSPLRSAGALQMVVLTSSALLEMGHLRTLAFVWELVMMASA